MKKHGKITAFILSTLLTLVLMFGAIGCDNGGKGKITPKPTPTPTPTVTVEITNLPETIDKGETVNLTATVTNAENTACTWSVDKPEVLMIDGTKLTVLKQPETFDEEVKITAKSVASPSASDTKVIRVLAPRNSGTVGLLTADMVRAIGNKSITVSGKVTDYYFDENQPFNNAVRYYDSLVKMEDGKWSGTWGTVDKNGDPISVPMTDYYMRGEQDVEDEFFNKGKPLQTMYIDKDNVVQTKNVTDYNSYSALWEDQHYYNHLESLAQLVDADHFTYDPSDTSRYEFTIDEQKSPEEEIYLMAYLAFSLTPMLDGSTDWFQTIILTVSDGKVTGLLGQTLTSYSGLVTDQSGNPQSWDSRAYTTVELSFSDIGTTKVGAPTTFAAPQHADKLTTALGKMKNASSYTFFCRDTQTSGSDIDPSEYETGIESSALAVKSARAAAEPVNVNPVNNNSATGTVGQRGWVTEDAVLIATTTMYSMTQDGKPYRTEYTGYKQFDGYYESFKYDANIKNTENVKVGGLKGESRIDGNIKSAMPTFTFSPNLFTCVQSQQSGKPVYVFTLANTSATHDIALELSSYTYAEDAQPNPGSSFTITVDTDGNLISCKYPYAFDGMNGYTTGYCEVNYSNVNATALDTESIFENYNERVIATSWDQLEVMHYRDENGEYVRDEKNYVIDPDGMTAIRSIFGSDYNSVPSPHIMYEIFGDNFSGPFYNDLGDVKEGTYKRGLSFTAESTEFDENAKITNLDELMTKAREVLEGLGYKDTVYTDLSGKYYDVQSQTWRHSDTYLVYDNEKITIVIENNRTKNFWIYIYKSGDYSRTLHTDTAA